MLASFQTREMARGFFNAMNFLEKDLEDIIFNTPNQYLQDRGLKIYGKKKRQLNIGNYGIADIITFKKTSELGFNDVQYTQFNIQILELKQKKIDYNSLKQVARYTKGIEHYLEERDFNFNINVSMVLIGKEIDKSDFIYLIDFVENLSCYTYSYDFDGIHFKLEQGYTLINSGFKFKNNKLPF